jgi:hypothetical protein
MKNKFSSHPTLEYQKLPQRDYGDSELSGTESDGSSIDLLPPSSTSVLEESSLQAEVANFTHYSQNKEMRLEIYGVSRWLGYCVVSFVTKYNAEFHTNPN